MLGHSWILLGGTDQAYIEAGVPLTILRTSFYWDNMIMFGIAGEHLTGAQFAATMSKVPLSAQPLRKLLRPLDPWPGGQWQAPCWSRTTVFRKMSIGY